MSSPRTRPVPPEKHITDWAEREERPDRRRARRPAPRRRDRVDARGRLELTQHRTRPAPDRGTARRRRGADDLGLGRSPRACIAFVFVGPLLALPASFLGDGFGFDQIARLAAARRAPDQPRCSRSASASARWSSAVGSRSSCRSTTSPVGAGSTGRSCCRWRCRGTCSCSSCSASTALASPLQSSLFGGCEIPGIRTPAGAICILTAVLYPYVYVLGRSAFLGQSRQTLEAARSLGHTYGRLSARRAPARAARARRRRRARGDGSARRLRHRQPPRCPGAHERDLPGVERCVRRGGGACSSPRSCSR